MSVYPDPKPVTPLSYHPTGNLPECPEGVALALLYTIMDADRSLTSRASNQPVASYILNLFAECLQAAKDNRRGDDGAEVRRVIQ